MKKKEKLYIRKRLDDTVSAAYADAARNSLHNRV